MRLRRSLFGLSVLAMAAAGCDSVATQPVPQVPLSSLVVAPAADTLHVGDSRAFTVTAIDTSGAPVTAPRLTWRSTVPSVVQVSSAGVARALTEGGALVIVTSGGKADTAAVIVLPSQSGWFTQTSNTDFDLFGVFMLPDGNTGWAVGAGGRIVHTVTAGRQWAPQTSGTAFTLSDVWFTSATEGWAVGASGTVMRTTNGGSSWSRVDAGTADNLYGVTFATRDTGWAVGGNGIILRTFDRGATWAEAHPTAVTLRGVSFAGTRHGWAVGDGGTILGTHDRGLTWFVVQPFVTGQTLRAVSRSSEPAARAVGDQGTMPRTIAGVDSTTWELRATGPVYQLYGAWSVNDLVGYSVGSLSGAGAVLVTDDGGVTNVAQVSNTQFRLNDVHFIDAQRGWAVGNNGAIIHTATGGEP